MAQFSRLEKTFFFLFFVLFTLTVNAAEPTMSASNISFPANQIDGGQFQLSFTSGNGAGRIVVLKEGSDITGVPQDFTKYNFNTAFGTAGTEFTAPGEYVVASTTSSAPVITITNLKAGTVYYIAIFEYNGTYSTPSSIDYSTITPTGKMVTTAVAPTTQATITGFSVVTGNSLKINYTNGNGTGRIIVAKKGTAITATPVDLTNYNSNNVFKGSTGSSFFLDAETFIVLKWNSPVPGGSGFVDVSNLEPNTTYTFAVFEYNSNTSGTSPVFLKSTVAKTIATSAGPTKSVTSVSFGTSDGNKINIFWANGNGMRRMVIAKKGSAVTTMPVNGNRYIATAQFGLGQEMLPGSGEFVVYDGNSNGLIVTNLETSTPYHFAIYEYDLDSTGYAYYLTSSFAVANNSTSIRPLNNVNPLVTSMNGSSALLNLQLPASGYGSTRLSVIRDGAPTSFLPVDLTQYVSNTSNYGSGTLVGTNTYLLYGQNNGTSINVTGLTPGHTYYVSFFEMNGSTAPVYLTPGASINFTIPSEPSTAATNPIFSSIEGNSIRFDWTNGNGARRIVVARKASAVASLPQDGANYTASTIFTSGTELATGLGEYVVYDGTGTNVTVTNLEKATAYHFAVFEYNSSATGPDYLTAAGKWLSTSNATVAVPLTQTYNLSASNIQSTQANITFTVGSGAGRIFIMHEGSPVDVEPAEFTNYSYNTSFGSVQIGTGNYIVSKGSSSFTVFNLKPGMQYYITSFEFNGNSAPVYQRPGATMYSFITTGGISAPTTSAQTPLFDVIDGNKFNFKWTNGNGAGRIVIARKNSQVSFVPVDGTTYAANSSFATGTDLGGGQFVVFNGAGNTVSLINLDAATSYYFAVYEYNGTGTNTKYLATALTANSSTATAPTQLSSSPITVPSASAITLSWTNGNGSGRIVIAKEGSAVTAIPVNLNKYAANAVFQNGPQLAPGEFVVYAGVGNSVNVSGLNSNKTYHFAVFEYNGIDAPVYNTANALTASATVLSALPVTWLYVRAMEKNGFPVIEWGTAQETNCDYYLVEKSTYRNDYTAIATVSASGNSNLEHHYSYIDKTNNGRVYYRIKQVDVDRKFSYSDVVQVMIEPGQVIKLLQNPVHEQLKIQATEQNKGNYISIADANGRELYRGKILSPLTTIAVDQLRPGNYYLVIRNQFGKSVAFPFIKL